ncbi:MAG: hypothetical protein AB1330_01810 [Bacillota bacterium]
MELKFSLEEIKEVIDYIAGSPLQHDFAKHTSISALLHYWVLNARCSGTYYREQRRLETLYYDIARNPNTPPEALAELAARTWENWALYYVACHSNCPAEVLEQLSKHRSSGVRCGVAKNPNTPVEVLFRMRKDPSKYVRENLARNPNTPTEALDHLSRSVLDEVCKGVAQNPSTSLETLLRMLEDKGRSVRKIIVEHLPLPVLLDIIYAWKRNDSKKVSFMQWKQKGLLDGRNRIEAVLAYAKLPDEVFIDVYTELSLLAKEPWSFFTDLVKTLLENPNVPEEVVVAASFSGNKVVVDTALEVLNQRRGGRVA